MNRLIKRISANPHARLKQSLTDMSSAIEENDQGTKQTNSNLNKRFAKLLASSLVMFFVLLFPSMRYGFAQEITHKQIEEAAQKSTITDKEGATIQILPSIPAKASKVKRKKAETKNTLTVLAARERTPTLQTKPTQQTR